jgi:hypothetical protein
MSNSAESSRDLLAIIATLHIGQVLMGGRS